jgi:hypothetical protein
MEVAFHEKMTTQQMPACEIFENQIQARCHLALGNFTSKFLIPPVCSPGSAPPRRPGRMSPRPAPPSRVAVAFAKKPLSNCYLHPAPPPNPNPILSLSRESRPIRPPSLTPVRTPRRRRSPSFSLPALSPRPHRRSCSPSSLTCSARPPSSLPRDIAPTRPRADSIRVRPARRQMGVRGRTTALPWPRAGRSCRRGCRERGGPALSRSGRRRHHYHDPAVRRPGSEVGLLAAHRRVSEGRLTRRPPTFLLSLCGGPGCVLVPLAAEQR